MPEQREMLMCKRWEERTLNFCVTANHDVEASVTYYLNNVINNPQYYLQFGGVLLAFKWLRVEQLDEHSKNADYKFVAVRGNFKVAWFEPGRCLEAVVSSITGTHTVCYYNTSNGYKIEVVLKNDVTTASLDLNQTVTCRVKAAFISPRPGAPTGITCLFCELVNDGEGSNFSQGLGTARNAVNERQGTVFTQLPGIIASSRTPSQVSYVSTQSHAEVPSYHYVETSPAAAATNLMDVFTQDGLNINNYDPNVVVGSTPNAYSGDDGALTNGNAADILPSQPLNVYVVAAEPAGESEAVAATNPGDIGSSSFDANTTNSKAGHKRQNGLEPSSDPKRRKVAEKIVATPKRDPTTPQKKTKSPKQKAKISEQPPTSPQKKPENSKKAPDLNQGSRKRGDLPPGFDFVVKNNKKKYYEIQNPDKMYTNVASCWEKYNQDQANAGTLAAHTKPDRTTFHSDSSEDELALAPKVTSTSAIGTPEEAGRPGGVMATAGGLGEATTTSPAAKTSSSSSGSKRRPSVRPVPTVILERTKKDKDCEDGKAAKKPGEPPKKQLSAAATTASVEAAAETKEAAMKQPAKKRNLPPGFDFIQWKDRKKYFETSDPGKFFKSIDSCWLTYENKKVFGTFSQDDDSVVEAEKDKPAGTKSSARCNDKIGGSDFAEHKQVTSKARGLVKMSSTKSKRALEGSKKAASPVKSIAQKESSDSDESSDDDATAEENKVSSPVKAKSQKPNQNKGRQEQGSSCDDDSSGEDELGDNDDSPKSQSLLSQAATDNKEATDDDDSEESSAEISQTKILQASQTKKASTPASDDDDDSDSSESSAASAKTKILPATSPTKKAVSTPASDDDDYSDSSESSAASAKTKILPAASPIKKDAKKNQFETKQTKNAPNKLAETMNAPNKLAENARISKAGGSKSGKETKPPSNSAATKRLADQQSSDEDSWSSSDEGPTPPRQPSLSKKPGLLSSTLKHGTPLATKFSQPRISPIGSVKGVAKVKSKQPSAASSPAASVSNSGKKKKKKAKLAGF